MFGLVKSDWHMVNPMLYSVQYKNWCLLAEYTLFGKVKAGTKELCQSLLTNPNMFTKDILGI